METSGQAVTIGAMPVARRAERTQQERRETTTAALIEAARGRFGSQGYAATSLDDIASDAGVSKGALYHHFPGGKQDLFQAVYEEEERRIAARTSAVFLREKDPWKGLYAGCRAFFDEIFDPPTQRITLLDGPSALGWEKMRSLQERYSIAPMKEALRRAMDQGIIERRRTDLLAHLLSAAVCEAALLTARAPDPRAKGREALAELRALLESMRIR